MNEWIIVEDRLPDQIGNIIVLVGNELALASVEKEPLGFVWINETAIYLLPMFLGEQIVEQGRWILPKKWKEPTHWLPLPAPPAKEIR